MKIIAKEYEKHYHNLTMVGEEKQIKYLILEFYKCHGNNTWIRGISKTGRGDKEKENSDWKVRNTRISKTRKISGQGDNKYLKNYVWFTDFSELAIKRNTQRVLN